jgi:uncharacterized protein YecT (DUF1311 family)
MQRFSLVLMGFLITVCASSALASYTPQEIEEGLAYCKQHPPGPQIEVNGCAEFRAANAELRLTRIYSALRSLLKKVGEPGAVAHLLKVQRAWIAFREASCESTDRGSMVPMLHSGCMESMADERSASLEDWLRAECERSCRPESDVAECKPCST